MCSDLNKMYHITDEIWDYFLFLKKVYHFDPLINLIRTAWNSAYSILISCLKIMWYEMIYEIQMWYTYRSVYW